MSDEDNIMREVEEDLRRERYERLWKRYGPFVIGTIVVVLASMVGWQYWEKYQQGQREQEAAVFLSAANLMEGGKEGAAANAFAELAEKSGPGYRAIARMHEAEAFLAQGNPDQALAAYDALAADGSVNAKLRALAALKGALLVADSASPEELKKRLAQPLRQASPWRFAAQEIVAYANYRTGRLEQARNDYQTLVNQYDAPAQIRERARNMVELIASEEAQDKGAAAAGAAGQDDGEAGEEPQAGAEESASENPEEAPAAVKDEPSGDTASGTSEKEGGEAPSDEAEEESGEESSEESPPAEAPSASEDGQE